MPIWSRQKSTNTGPPPPVSVTPDVIDGVAENELPVDVPNAKNGGGPVPAPRSGRKTSANQNKSNQVTTPAPPATKPPPPPPPSSQLIQRPKLVFHCQQAHGSPTGIISGFTSIKELYDKIAQCYDFPASEILYCTLNTHKVDMNFLLGGQIGLEDFIFAHRKGQPKEIDITKSEEALGLTITDNGAGYCFIKKIREGSIIEQAGFIQIGDHIERIDDQNLVGKKHFEVAKMLKEIPKGSTFTLRLIEPLKAGFANIGPRSNPSYGKKSSYGSGRETLRLRASGPATVQEAPDDIIQAAVEKINNLLESFLGINDTDLATQIWEMGQTNKNTIDFQEALENSDLNEFGFTEDFVFDLWGIVGDAKAGRLPR